MVIPFSVCEEYITGIPHRNYVSGVVVHATGNNVSGISYGTYQDVEGVGLGFSLTSGRLAGIQAARNAGYEVEDDTTALTETGKETMQTATERGMNGNLESH